MVQIEGSMPSMKVQRRLSTLAYIVGLRRLRSAAWGEVHASAIQMAQIGESTRPRFDAYDAGNHDSVHEAHVRTWNGVREGGQG
jgi:hypothetical protein